ncbi:MAG TPA: phage tail assembly chaperone [Croceibacterium sp.]|nr:phage tail assembly chaperone [Croceibacterium sp.]
MTFAAGALRLAGLTARALGWRPDDFWNATPAELAAILAPEANEDVTPLGREELARLMEKFRDG